MFKSMPSTESIRSHARHRPHTVVVEVKPVQYYKLIEKRMVAAKNVFDWADWRKTHADSLIIGVDAGCGWQLSTFFVGVDTSDDPILFESLLTLEGSDSIITRHPTWEAANHYHQSIVWKLEHDNDRQRGSRTPVLMDR